MPRQKPKRNPRSEADFKNFIPIPIVNQATDYTCGVAAMLSVLYYWDKGEDDYEVELAIKLSE